MSKHKEVINLIKSVSGQSNVLTIPRVFIDITGDHLSALFLSQCVYWSDRGKDDWFYKSDKEWNDELAISAYQVRRIRGNLESFLETKIKKANGAPTTHYRIRFEVLSKSIVEKLNNPLLRNSKMESEITEQSLTETTTETTAKNINGNFSKLSAAFWTITGIPEPAPGGRGWSEWEDGINQLIKIDTNQEEMAAAKIILDEAKYTCNRPAALVKTIVNTRNGNQKHASSDLREGGAAVRM